MKKDSNHLHSGSRKTNLLYYSQGVCITQGSSEKNVFIKVDLKEKSNFFARPIHLN